MVATSRVLDEEGLLLGVCFLVGLLRSIAAQPIPLTHQRKKEREVMRENWQRREEKRGGEGGEDVKLDKGEKRDKPKTDATTIERVSCPNPDFSEDICISRCCTSFFLFVRVEGCTQKSFWQGTIMNFVSPSTWA